MPGPDAPLDILYEDNHLMVVNKPPGLASQPDRTGDPCVVDRIRALIKARDVKPGNVYATAVHRLDRPAAGALLIAKTSKAAARLSAAFREGRVHKDYLIVVEGVPPRTEGSLSDWLAKDRARNSTRVTGPKAAGAKEARLSYTLLTTDREKSLVRVVLETGRGHQIRVQFANIGCPVLGDRRYGSNVAMGPAIALYASRIRFEHPVREEWITVTAPPPLDWKPVVGPGIWKRVCEESASDRRD